MDQNSRSDEFRFNRATLNKLSGNVRVAHVIPAIALAFSVGCSTNGDYIPYSDLPPAAVQDEHVTKSPSDGTQPPSDAKSLSGGSEPAQGSVNMTIGADSAEKAATQPVSTETPSTEAAKTDATIQGASEANPAAAADINPTSQTTEPATNGKPADLASEPKSVVSKQSGLVGPADVPQIENAAAEVREVKLLIPEKKFLPERGTAAVRVSYDDIDLLKVLNMEPVPANAAEHFPNWLQDLNGKPVRIRGFMYPTFEASGLTEFTMARDNGICCFVRKPKIYDVIGVSLAEGVTTDYIEGRPFDVEGTFHIEPEGDELGLYRLYRISNARVVR